MSEQPPKPDPASTVKLNGDQTRGTHDTPVHEQLGEFEILGELGRGGMGVVYEAYQSSLDRRVALKVLPPAFSMNPEATKRFEREARAAARLQHRNIVAVHAIGQDRGQCYYAMELVDGDSLDQVLLTLSGGSWHPLLDGALAADRSGVDRSVVESQFHTGDRAWADIVSSLIADVAEGLEYAHSQGVVHRDIKPANLMLSTQGQVRITDFGLARSTQEPGITMSGALVGTPAYMSPEQVAAGRMPLDHRTDIYSLGAVLYEMLTLERPFRGESRDEVIGGVLTKDPTTPRHIRSAIPRDLETICLKALEKDPDRRYQTAGEMANDLREYLRRGMIAARPMSPWRKVVRAVRRHPTASTMAATLAIIGVAAALNWDRLQNVAEPGASLEFKRIAVLPFRNASGDATQDFYADGMTEVLIADLGQIAALAVIAQRSVLRYNDTSKSIREIADELNVDAIVEGSVLRSEEGRVRVTATLTDATTESQIWGDRYERSLQDILMLQGEVARAIANQIRVELTPEERAVLTVSRVVNPQAHEAYLIGKSFVDKWSRDAVEKGIAYLEQALEYDPDYAQAHAGLATAYVYSATVGGGWSPPGEVIEKARAEATRALELDESLAEAHTALGSVSAVFDWDIELGERELKRAIELNPSFADARIMYGVLLRRLGGRLSEALDQFKLALETDPLNPWARVHVIWTNFESGDRDAVYEECRQLLDLRPEPVLQAQGILAEAFLELQAGRVEEGVASIERCVELTDRKNPDMLTYLATTYESIGRHEDAMGILDEITVLADERYVSPVLFAQYYASLGNIDEAFAFLEKAFELHCGYLFMLSSGFPELHSDPRWDDLVKRIGLPERIATM